MVFVPKQTVSAMMNFFRNLFGPSELRQRPHSMNGYVSTNGATQSSNINISDSYIKWDVRNEKLELSNAALQLLELPWDSLITYDNVEEIAYPEDLEHIRTIVGSIFVKKFFP